MKKNNVWIFCLFVLAICLVWNSQPGFGFSTKTKMGIPAKLAADYVHSVIEAGRQTYSKQIVDRLSKTISLQATENWQTDHTLLLPAQFLLASSQLSNTQGIGMRYRLMSLWPINKKNSPRSSSEKLGLQQVAEHPDKPFKGVVQRNGRLYYQAIYPDIAVADTCVSCHNNHPQSPKTDFKRGDVMGGIIIDLPLQKDPGKSFLLTPEVVSDYVHSVLESDRTIYSKYIVNRLEKRNILFAKENWKKENALLLPAQFLLHTSLLTRDSGLGLDFRLISLWPINAKNKPANDFERIGLETVEIHPIRPYIDRTVVGKKHYFQAVYPDFAVTKACVHCHNSHAKSPKQDFKLHDVMGGIAVTLPLGQGK